MPPVLEKEQTSERPATKHRHGFGGRLLISTIRFVVIMLLAAMIGGGWYLAKKGFGREWRRRVVEELHKRGVEVSIRLLTLNPFRGLVAKDVRIFDYKNRGNTLALISEISLDINYAALLHRQPFLNAIDIRNAQIWLPLNAPEKRMRQARVKNFRAHVYFPPEQIYVSQAEGIVAGVRVSITGQLIKRENYQSSPPMSEQEWQERLATLSDLVTQLEKFSFPGGSPTLQVKFSGDLANMENAHVEATLRGDAIRRGNYELRNLAAAAEYADQRLDLRQCEWSDNAGVFSARLSWSRQSGEADFQARSSIDLKSFLEAFNLAEPLTDATFATSPSIELSGEMNLADPHHGIKIIGNASVRNFAYHGIALTDLAADFSWDGERILVRDLHVNQGEGRLKADLLSAPGDFRLTIDSTINPVALRGFLSLEMQDFLGQWEFQRPPAVHLQIRGPDKDPQSWNGNGTIALNRTRFRGAWLNSATSKIHFGDGAVTYDNLRVVRAEGTAAGSFTYDFKKHEVRISNIKGSVYPAEMIVWVDPDLPKTVAPYKFHQPPNISANGVYRFGGGRGTKIDINVDAPRGMDYMFLGKTLPFDRISGKLIFTDDRLQITELKGGIFSGTTQGSADISLARNDSHHRARVAVDHIDFTRLTELYFNYKSAQGQLNGSYDFTGVGSDARLMRGTGKLRVTNGNVFAIPVFGPLSDILNAVVPGSGYSIARDATASFTIKDGIFNTEDLDAAGRLFSMLGHGDIHFLDDKLDFTVRMDMHGPGVLLAPVYKLFEYTGEGSLKHPNWHPKRF
jgi:hypothetical protein